ncbi:Tm-1-like ATP-binding domain-containing protein [Arundinibacter roseus]|uniref:UPF0261 family protein n=1 Tax=Arundinibacter roseus TaxID=2070510 RepID=A0A4R4JZT7_9BACT|nr:Tm-1-like ATP-binding domain-containing protein [Arundinibacter roseus]TDB59531.1 UPF0261 family protein [Arundinibacter roseus]
MFSNEKYVLVLGCFDSKGDIFSLLIEKILSYQERVITINTGVYGTNDAFRVDYEADTVAREGGYELAHLQSEGDRGKAIEVMGRGATVIVARLVAEGKVKAAVGMGGGGGTYIVLAAMQPIPLGIPKVCLSTVASKDLSRQVGHKDVTLISSVVDVAGTNHILNALVVQTAAAVCAMANVPPNKDPGSIGSIAISMFGNTTACVDKCTVLLKQAGYEVMAFHATGAGGRTMEALIREGSFDAVLDVTTTELADDLCGGICSAGPTRLTAASEMGLPQVVVPGCLDMVNFAQLDTVPAHYQNRHLYSWAPDVTLMRTSVEENLILGQKLAVRVSESKAPASIVIPLRGLSQVDSHGGIFYKPEANAALFRSIREHVAEHVSLYELDMHINDTAFAKKLVDILLELLVKKNTFNQ